jgi:DNA-directed RNA polymerase subunit E'/Rpb7
MNITNLKDLYTSQIIQINEALPSLNELNMTITTNTSDAIDVYLENKIRNKIGGHCLNVGYIDKNDVKIVSRSIGKINTSHFNGEIYFHIQLEVKVCKPIPNQLIEAKIVGKNKIGLMCILGPLQIIIPFSHHEDASFYNLINKDDKILLKIVNSKFQLNDDHIKVIGEFIKKV